MECFNYGIFSSHFMYLDNIWMCAMHHIKSSRSHSMHNDAQVHAHETEEFFSSLLYIW